MLQGFRDENEVQRFGQLMDEMCYIVATKHSGSLKVPPPSCPSTCSCLDLPHSDQAVDMLTYACSTSAACLALAYGPCSLPQPACLEVYIHAFQSIPGS